MKQRSPFTAGKEPLMVMLTDEGKVVAEEELQGNSVVKKMKPPTKYWSYSLSLESAS